jgi:hypothetical protein
MQKLCLCLAKAAGTGTCGVGGQFGQCNVEPDMGDAEVVKLDVGDYREQFFTMFVDLLQFILFDRDCNPDSFKKSNDCGSCCPAPPSQEEWLKSRCRAGTGDGKCVVASGVCTGFRRKDDYKPLVSSLLAVKHAMSLISLDRSDVQGQASYAEQVGTVYNNIVTDYYNLYKDHGDTLTFYPDCAAPQFCCSTVLAADKCQYNCCRGNCENIAGACLFPVPSVDTRKATWCCGEGVAYSAVTGNCFSVLCEAENSGGEVDKPVTLNGNRWDCFSNPCVVMPFCAATVNCEEGC